MIYKAKVGRAFANELFWGLVKGNRKWLDLKSPDHYVGMTKRSKTSESAHTQSSDARIGGINLNNYGPYEVPTHPMRRDNAKRMSKEAQSSSTEVEEIRSDIKELDNKLEAFLELGKIKVSNRAIKERDRVLKHLLTPGENLSEEDRQIFNNVKKDFAKEYNRHKP